MFRGSEAVDMNSLRSRWFWFLLVALAGLPLSAEQSTSPTPPHSVPDGTTFLIRLEDELDASRVRPGKRFKAELAEDLVGPDESRILRHSKIKGHVSSVSNGLHPGLLLSFDEIETEHGWVPLFATISAIPGEHGLEVSGSEGEIQRQGSHGREGGSSGGGLGGDGGRGPTLGAAAGVVGALFSDRRLQLQKGTALEIRLDRALKIPRR
jgi:hypothetical protein